MKEAFTYMFKDNMFKKKAFMYFVFALIAGFIVQCANTYLPSTPKTVPPIQYYLLWLLGTFAMFIPQGYNLNCIRAIMEQRENPILPFMNIKNSFIIGFKFYLSLFIFMLGIVAASIVYCIIIGILSSLHLQILSILMCLFLILFLLVFLLVFIIYIPAFCCTFAKTELLTIFFRFVRVTKLIKQDIVNYFKYVGLYAVFFIGIFIISILISIPFQGNIIGAFIIAFLTSLIGAYTSFVAAYLTARAVKPEFI